MPGEGLGEARRLEGVSPDEAELAMRLARALKNVRPTSRFAIRTFLAAIEEDGVIGAELAVRYDHRQGHLECESRIRAPE